MIRAKELICLTAVLMGLTSCQNDNAIISQEVEANSNNAITGKDDRRLTVDSLNKTFYRKVGQLRTEVKYGDSGINKISTCSATLINEKFVITAAHCAYLGDTNDLLKNTYFYPGIDGVDKFDSGRYPVVRVYHPELYDNEYFSSSEDIAILELGVGSDGKNAGQRVGTHGFWGKESFPSGETLTIGYPGDKPSARQFYESGCDISNSKYNHLSLNVECDVIKGQSGSPIFVYNSEYDNFYIHGVISSESRTMNFGSFLSKERQKIINTIIKGSFSTNNDFEEKWITKKIVQDNLVRILVKNTCRNDIARIALNFKNVEGEWEKIGFYSVGVGETSQLAVSPNGVFYLHARSSNWKTIISGGNVYELPGSGSQKFKRYSTDKYGDYVVNVPCY
ncbi:trypsin-like serine peptidase [Halobacteriovorax sp. ZH4_bin.1]|uniref:trypsin-like serine peptidase n=1 Tax=unclassified Halobacteriovorax TaxID=2639665 RepID=UPI003718F0EE